MTAPQDKRPEYRLEREPDGRSWTARENLVDILERELLGPRRSWTEFSMCHRPFSRQVLTAVRFAHDDAMRGADLTGEGGRHGGVVVATMAPPPYSVEEGPPRDWRAARGQPSHDLRP